MAETQTSFHGAVSFPQLEDARQFRSLINAFLDSSSRVFFEIEKNPMFHMDVVRDAKALVQICENFELNAIAFSFHESQDRCKRAFEELTGHVADLEKGKSRARSLVVLKKFGFEYSFARFVCPLFAEEAVGFAGAAALGAALVAGTGRPHRAVREGRAGLREESHRLQRERRDCGCGAKH